MSLRITETEYSQIGALFSATTKLNHSDAEMNTASVAGTGKDRKLIETR